MLPGGGRRGSANEIRVVGLELLPTRPTLWVPLGDWSGESLVGRQWREANSPRRSSLGRTSNHVIKYFLVLYNVFSSSTWLGGGVAGFEFSITVCLLVASQYVFSPNKVVVVLHLISQPRFILFIRFGIFQHLFDAFYSI